MFNKNIVALVTAGAVAISGISIALAQNWEGDPNYHGDMHKMMDDNDDMMKKGKHHHKKHHKKHMKKKIEHKKEKQEDQGNHSGHDKK